MMSPSGLNHLPIEYISLDNTIPLVFLILGFLQVSLYIILDWDNKIYSFFWGSESSSSIRQQPSDQVKGSTVRDVQKKKDTQDSESLKKKHDDESICKEDVDLVLRSLGFLSHANIDDGAKLEEERLDCNDIFNLFEEEKEPNKYEVKAAFDVFDENKDGFIDAWELQRILRALGLREGSELENCRKMIWAFDENEDDRIDFNEFVKIMESGFC
ncbi:hypothetical protein ACH5RR_011189 [Cinchona calisaya]|uniref:EF-hand domain-containing protein n=1 Tax=Cinchona calisaya TaxID=153742 RepID=A0ABD3A9Y8_9GENT